jgi:two-component system KDP operon response regulator KdpE
MDGLPARILVVDDERPIRRFLRASLSAQGYQVTEAATGKEALAAAVTDHPDLMILDLGLPDMDGVEVTRQIREWSDLPIVILSVRDSEKDKVTALDAGADDYLGKPFGTGELLARLRVALRRTGMAAGEAVFRQDELEIDWNRRVVLVQKKEITLTPTEYELLRALVRNAGRVLTHHYLLRTIWGAGYEYDLHILRVNMSNLRRKIEPDPTRPRFILTEPGVGYRFKADER